MSADNSKIEQLAYSIWEDEGRPEGRAVDHWLQAEALVTSVSAPKAKAGAKPKAPAKAPADKRKAAKPAMPKAAKPAKSASATAAAKA